MGKFLNLKLRLNPYTISGIISTIFTALRINPASFTSWALVLDELKQVVSNPFLLFTMIIAILGILHDPTTKGFSDSTEILEQSTKKE